MSERPQPIDGPWGHWVNRYRDYAECECGVWWHDERNVCPVGEAERQAEINNRLGLDCGGEQTGEHCGDCRACRRIACADLTAALERVIAERDRLLAALVDVRGYLTHNADPRDGVAWQACVKIDKALGVKP